MNEEENVSKSGSNSGERSGGINVGGNFSAPGANIAGRDLNVYYQTRGITADEFNRYFAPLMQSIQSVPPEKRQEAEEKVEALKAELAQGEKVNDSRLAGLIDGLVALVPSAVQTVVSIFANPILAGLAGPVTKSVLERLTGG
jgi:hypothetical protein